MSRAERRREMRGNGCRRRFSVEKIICIPTKSDKLRISVRITGEMVKDFCDCARKAYTMSGKDCDTMQLGRSYYWRCWNV